MTGYDTARPSAAGIVEKWDSCAITADESLALAAQVPTCVAMYVQHLCEVDKASGS